MTYAVPILFVLFTWWFSTGVVIYMNNMPSRNFRWTVSAATALLPICLASLYELRVYTTPSAAYWSFTYGLIAWAWTQLTFYTGFITGPRQTACEQDCGGVRHFWHAIETCLYHELLAIGVGVAIFAVSYGGGNWCGAWTYAILWIMHSSAKINAVLGIRNLNEEFFPSHLKYLRSFLRERPINALFPFSVTGGTIAAVILFQNAAHAVAPFGFLNAVFLGTMMALAVLEHWLLILPIPAAALWGWGLSSKEESVEKEPKKEPAPPLVLRRRPIVNLG
jgi:putative photosynthetic complex assembly protein 2